MTTRIGIRLGVEGGAELKRTLEDAGTTGQAAFQKVGAAADQAGAATDRQTARYQKMAQAAREAEAQARAQASVNETLGVGTGSAGSARASAGVFEAELARQDQILAARQEQAARNAQSRFNDILGVRDTSAGSARASAAAFEEAERRAAERREATRSLIASRETSVANDIARASSFQSGLNDRLGIRGPMGEGDRAADIAAYGAELDRVRARYVPLAAAQRDYLAQLRDIRQAVKAGALTQAEGAAVIASTKDAFARQVADLRTGSGPNRGLRGFEVQNLTAQGIDIGVSLQGGMNPLTVLLQQGGQIAPMFVGPGSASVKGALGQAGDAIGAFVKRIGPVGLAMGGLATAAGVGTAALLSYRSAQREVELSIAGVGRTSGVTLGQINALADAQSRALRLSTSETREIAATYVSTGRVGAELLPGAVGASRGFAGFLGVDDKEGATALAGLLSDTSRGATELAERYGLLSDAQAESIRRMTAQGDQLGAQKRLLDAVRDSTRDLAGETSRWTRVTTVISDTWGGLGSILDRALGGTGGGTDERIQAVLQDRLRYLRSSIGRAASSRGGDLFDSQQAIDETKRELDAVERRIARTKGISEEMQRAWRSTEIGGIVRAVQPDVIELRSLQDRVEQLRKSISDPIRFGLNQQQVNDATTAFERLSRITRGMAEDIERFGSVSVAALNRAADFSLRTSTMNPVERAAAEIRRDYADAVRSGGLDPGGISATFQRGMTSDPFERQRLLESMRTEEGLRRNRDVRLQALAQGTEQNATRSIRLPEGIVQSIIGAESNGRNNARNPLSSATGAGQFIDDTWLKLFKDRFAERAAGMSDADILARRTNRADSEAMVEAYAQVNARALERARLPVNATSLYMGHHFGEGGMLAMLRADPNAMARDVLGARAANANPRTIGNLTVGQSIEALRNSVARNEPGIRASRDQVEIMRSQIGVTEQSAAGQARLERAQELLNAARAKGTDLGRAFATAQDLIKASSETLTPEMQAERRAILETADAYARATAVATEFRGRRELMFERDQLGRSDIDASAYGRARAMGYGDLNGEEAQAFIGQARLNSELRLTKDLSREAFGGLVADMRRGVDFGNALANSLNRLTDRLADLALDQAFSGLFAGEGKQGGGWISAAIASAKSAFTAADGRVPAYADGKTPSVSAAGIISGPGGPRDDSVLAWVSNREAIIRASSVERYGVDFIRSINEGTAPREIALAARPGMRRHADGTVPARDAFTMPRSIAPQMWGGAPSGPQTLKLEVINQNGSQVTTREVADGRGGRKQQIVIAEAVASGIRSPQGQQALGQRQVAQR